MTFTSLLTPLPNAPVSVANFGALVKQNFDDHEGRIASNSAILGTWSGGTVISRLILLEDASYAKFSQNTAQTMTTASNTKMQFPNNVATNTSLVTAGGTSQDTFTVVKAGKYMIKAGARAATAGAVLEIAIFTGTTFAVGNVKGLNGSGGRSVGCAAEISFAVGDTFGVNIFNSGTTSNVDTTWGTATHISIKYEGI